MPPRKANKASTVNAKPTILPADTVADTVADSTTERRSRRVQKLAVNTVGQVKHKATTGSKSTMPKTAQRSTQKRGRSDSAAQPLGETLAKKKKIAPSQAISKPAVPRLSRQSPDSSNHHARTLWPSVADLSDDEAHSTDSGFNNRRSDTEPVESGSEDDNEKLIRLNPNELRRTLRREHAIIVCADNVNNNHSNVNNADVMSVVEEMNNLGTDDQIETVAVNNTDDEMGGVDSNSPDDNNHDMITNQQGTISRGPWSARMVQRQQEIPRVATPYQAPPKAPLLHSKSQAGPMPNSIEPMSTVLNLVHDADSNGSNLEQSDELALNKTKGKKGILMKQQSKPIQEVLRVAQMSLATFIYMSNAFPDHNTLRVSIKDMLMAASEELNFDALSEKLSQDTGFINSLVPGVKDRLSHIRSFGMRTCVGSDLALTYGIPTNKSIEACKEYVKDLLDRDNYCYPGAPKPPNKKDAYQHPMFVKYLTDLLFKGDSPIYIEFRAWFLEDDSTSDDVLRIPDGAIAYTATIIFAVLQGWKTGVFVPLKRNDYAAKSLSNVYERNINFLSLLKVRKLEDYKQIGIELYEKASKLADVPIQGTSGDDFEYDWSSMEIE